MTAVRACRCGAELPEDGDALACPRCGPAEAWRVLLDGVPVAAATAAEVLLSDGLAAEARAVLYASGPPRFRVALAPGRRGR